MADCKQLAMMTGEYESGSGYGIEHCGAQVGHFEMLFRYVRPALVGESNWGAIFGAHKMNHGEIIAQPLHLTQ